MMERHSDARVGLQGPCSELSTAPKGRAASKRRRAALSKPKLLSSVEADGATFETYWKSGKIAEPRARSLVCKKSFAIIFSNNDGIPREAATSSSISAYKPNNIKMIQSTDYQRTPHGL